MGEARQCELRPLSRLSVFPLLQTPPCSRGQLVQSTLGPMAIGASLTQQRVAEPLVKSVSETAQLRLWQKEGPCGLELLLFGEPDPMAHATQA